MEAVEKRKKNETKQKLQKKIIHKFFKIDIHV